MRRYVESRGRAAAQRLVSIVDRHGGDVFLMQREFFIAYHHECDAAGQTLIGQWEAGGFPGLTNDERQIVRSMAAARLCLIEVHRQIDEDTVQAVDLLEADPQPFLIVDRSLAGVWVRFATLLAWCYPTPHFWRLGGATREVREMGSATPSQAVVAVAAHLGGPTALTDAREWMTENIERVVESLLASSKAAWKAMMSELDIRFGKARYRWANPNSRALVERKLRAAPGVEESELGDDDAGQGWEVCFDVLERWLMTPTQPELRLAPAIPRGPGEPVVGSILIGGTEFWSGQPLGRGSPN
jgi:hypothetical protein